MYSLGETLLEEMRILAFRNLLSSSTCQLLQITLAVFTKGLFHSSISVIQLHLIKRLTTKPKSYFYVEVSSEAVRLEMLRQEMIGSFKETLSINCSMDVSHHFAFLPNCGCILTNPIKLSCPGGLPEERKDVRMLNGKGTEKRKDAQVLNGRVTKTQSSMSPL
ncbi:hypothetical protein STEG23_008594, partial [Scotinomys teguina]